MDMNRRTGPRREDDVSIEQAAIEAARDASRRTALRAARGYFLLLLVLFLGAFAYQRVTDKGIRNAAFHTCRRVNILRVQEANRNAQVVWAALYYSRQREYKLARNGVNEGLHRLSADYITDSINAMRWTPTTNCREAVNHPTTYKAPRPMPFTPRFLNFRIVPR